MHTCSIACMTQVLDSHACVHGPNAVVSSCTHLQQQGVPKACRWPAPGALLGSGAQQLWQPAVGQHWQRRDQHIQHQRWSALYKGDLWHHQSCLDTMATTSSQQPAVHEHERLYVGACHRALQHIKARCSPFVKALAGRTWSQRLQTSRYAGLAMQQWRARCCTPALATATPALKLPPRR
jgi:hypothetical protein